MNFLDSIEVDIPENGLFKDIANINDLPGDKRLKDEVILELIGEVANHVDVVKYVVEGLIESEFLVRITSSVDDNHPLKDRVSGLFDLDCIISVYYKGIISDISTDEEQKTTKWLKGVLKSGTFNLGELKIIEKELLEGKAKNIINKEIDKREKEINKNENLGFKSLKPGDKVIRCFRNGNIEIEATIISNDGCTILCKYVCGGKNGIEYKSRFCTEKGISLDGEENVGFIKIL